MKAILQYIIFTLLVMQLNAQQTITIHQDTIFYNTYQVNTNTILDVNGYTVQFKGTPQITVTNKATLLIKNGNIINFNRWGTALCGSIEWRVNNSKGSISNFNNGYTGFNSNFWLDGVAK